MLLYDFNFSLSLTDSLSFTSLLLVSAWRPNFALNRAVFILALALLDRRGSEDVVEDT